MSAPDRPTVATDARTAPPRPQLASLPRLGLHLQLPPSLERAEWFGRGPHENYADRCSGALVGRHEASVPQLFTPYLCPSENGHRCDVRWLRLSSDASSHDAAHGGVGAGEEDGGGDGGGGDGAGLQVAPGQPASLFGFSASRYGVAALERAKHPHELEEEPCAAPPPAPHLHLVPTAASRPH